MPCGYVSSRPTFRTVLEAFTSYGSTPSVCLHGYPHEASVPISPAPQCIPCRQLARALGTFVPIFPKTRGLRHQSSSWCTWLSHAPTTTPHPPLAKVIGVSSRVSPFLLSTLLAIPWQASRVHSGGLQQHAVGGVLLNAPSPLWGSPVFLQGRVRLTWSPMRSHPMEEA